MYLEYQLTIKKSRLGLKDGLDVFGGGGEGGGVGLPGQGPQLRLHLRGATRDARGADLQVDT